MTNPPESADFVVVGSGAAGGIAAYVLAELGYSVVVLEEGPPIDRALSARSTGETLSRYFRDAGGQLGEGKAFIPVLQGRCLGGSTAINSAICWRIPEDAYERTFGQVRHIVPLEVLEQGYDWIERELGIHPVEEAVLGNNNRLLRRGAEALGWEGRVISRNERGCVGSGACLQACPAGKKQSADRTWLPRAAERGASIHTGWEVRQLIPARPGHPAQVLARATHDGGSRGRCIVVARRGVLLAASVVQTPAILLRSGLGNRHVGKHFRAHPGSAVMGLYDEPVRQWEGATQGYEVTHFRRDGHFKIETVAMPPELGAARLPGAGARLMRALEEWGYTSNWGVQIRAETEGSIWPRLLLPGTRIRYSLSSSDMAILRKGVRAACELAFAAGAREVIPAVYGLPERLTSLDQLSLIDDAPLDPRAWTMIASHLFGTCRLHPDPAQGAVGERFQVHGAPGIHVIDASLFPLNPGVNPQHTIMAMAAHAARVIAG